MSRERSENHTLKSKELLELLIFETQEKPNHIAHPDSSHHHGKQAGKDGEHNPPPVLQAFVDVIG